MCKQVCTWTMLAVLLSAAACGGDDDDSSGAGTEELAAPTGLKAEPLDGGAHLTWKDNSAEAEFMIERMDHGSGSADWETLAKVPFDTTQYHDASVKAGTTYMYRVMPMSKDGKHGSTSNEVTFMASGGSAGSGGN